MKKCFYFVANYFLHYCREGGHHRDSDYERDGDYRDEPPDYPDERGEHPPEDRDRERPPRYREDDRGDGRWDRDYDGPRDKWDSKSSDISQDDMDKNTVSLPLETLRI